jgi:hypothetical protein
MISSSSFLTASRAPLSRRCSAEIMQLRLDEIATKVAPGARHFHPRSSRLARCQATQNSRQHLSPAVAAARARAQQPRKHMAVRAAELAIEPRLQILRRHRRSLLLCLEHPYRNATGRTSVIHCEGLVEVTSDHWLRRRSTKTIRMLIAVMAPCVLPCRLRGCRHRQNVNDRTGERPWP